MKHILELRHKAHLAEVGITGELKHVHADDAAYQKAKDHWKATMPGASEDDLHIKALANIAWKQQNAPVAPKVETPSISINFKPLLKPLWICVGLLALLVLLSVDAHCQFSHVNTISATDGTNTVFSASPFKITFSGCTVGGTGAAWTISCTGGAANPGGSAHQLQVNLSGTGFAGVANGTAGQVLCSNGTSSDPAMCDPVVSGPDAPGVAPTKPPVQVGLFDGTNVQRVLGSSAGRLSVDVNSAPTTAVTGTFFQATQPVSATSLPLPTGAATAAKQPALGTAGTASADVITVQGKGSMTPLLVDGSGATQPVSGSVTVTQATGTNLHTVCDSGCSSSTAPADGAAFTEGTTSFSPFGGYFRTSPTSLTTDHMGAVGMTATRHLFVNLPDALPAGTNVIGHVIADSGSTTAVTGNVASTVADGANVTLGAKADAKSTATDTTAVTVMQVLKEISALEQAPASRAVTNAGTFAVQAGLPTTVDTNSGNKSASTLRVVLATDQPALTNKLLVTPDPTIPEPSSASGDAVTACNILSAASTNATSCKGSAGNFYGFEIYNTTTTIYYLRLYNTASAPTCSSATGFIRSIPIPPAAASGQAGGVSPPQFYPVNYGTGIGYCITGGSSSTDNTNAATGIFGEIRYK